MELEQLIKRMLSAVSSSWMNSFLENATFHRIYPVGLGAEGQDNDQAYKGRELNNMSTVLPIPLDCWLAAVSQSMSLDPDLLFCKG